MHAVQCGMVTQCEKSSVFHIRSNATLPSFRSPRSAPLIPLHECYRMLPCNTASGDDVQSLWIDKLAILLERGDAHDSAVEEDGKGNADPSRHASRRTASAHMKLHYSTLTV